MPTLFHPLPRTGWQLTWTDTPDAAPDWAAAIDAEVPGGVLLDLLRAGRIPDPFRDDYFRAAAWTAEKTFHYRTFVPIELFGGWAESGEVALRFDCLDLYAQVRLNGRLAGETANMFRRHHVPVRRSDLAGQTALELWVTLLPMLTTARERMASLGAGQDSLICAFGVNERPYMRKMQMAFGWDNCPHLIAGGIVRDVVVETRSGPCLGDFTWAVPHVDPPRRQATLQMQGEAAAAAGGTVRITGECGEHRWSGRSAVRADGTWEVVLELEDARLWWPHGLGDASLYHCALALEHDGAVQDERAFTLALRTVEVQQRPVVKRSVNYTLPREPRAAMDGGMLASWTRLPLPQPEEVEVEPFHLHVNGERVFIRGANMQTPDAIPGRLTPGTYERLTEFARQANMNMLRLWGGGLVELDAFYEACARQGLMVWQDFHFACAQYPRHADFLAEVEREVDDVIRRLRNHPAIVVWCGDNESDMIDVGAGRDATGNPVNKVIIPRALVRLDLQRRYYHPSSPSGGGYPRSEWGGDRRDWGPWYPEGNYAHIRLDQGRLLSEGGSYALPDRATLDAYVSPEYQWPIDNPVLRLHTGDLDFSERRFDRLNANCWAHFQAPRTVEEAVRVSQFAQALGMRRLAEHYRWRFPDAGGALLWKLNDAWPAIDAGLIDYALRPRLALAEVGAAFAPVSLAFIEPIEGTDRLIRLWVYNDSREPVSASVEVATHRVDDSGIATESTVSIPVHLPPGARRAVETWRPDAADNEHRVWSARMSVGQAPTVEARHAQIPRLLWLFAQISPPPATRLPGL